MARISLNPPQTVGYRLAARFSRRRYGVMLDPGAAIGHNMQVGRSYAIFEMQVERWRQLRSARARREAYVGPWLPEPLLTTIPDTEGRAEPW